MQAVMNFIVGNISYILLAVAVIYMIFFAIGVYRAKKHGEHFSFRIKYLFAFLIIIGFAIYCLVTGKDFTQYIG